MKKVLIISLLFLVAVSGFCNGVKEKVSGVQTVAHVIEKTQEDTAYISSLKETLASSTLIMEKQNQEIERLKTELESEYSKNKNLVSALEDAKEQILEFKATLNECKVNLEASNKEILRASKRTSIIGGFIGSNSAFDGYNLGVIVGSKLGPGYLNGVIDVNTKRNELGFNIGYSIVF